MLQAFPATLSQIVHFFQKVADDCRLECCNQDLVGFFTSIPVFRIMGAVDWMLQQFMLKHDIDPATYSFSISLREKDSKLRAWKGKHFAALGRVFAQQRGAAIGNQISPVLASISMAFLVEQTWYNQYEYFLSQVSNQFLCLRYVDNRIVLINKSLTGHPAFQHFLHNDF